MTPRHHIGFAPKPETMLSDFTVESTDAPLIEVTGSGPYTDRPNGLAVPKGAATRAATSLLHDFIRSFRVDAPATTQTTVRVPQSPYGVFVGVRRCVGAAADWRWSLRYLVARVLSVREPHSEFAADWRRSLLHVVAPCVWKDVVPNDGAEVEARGGDVVVVSFVVP